MAAVVGVIANPRAGKDIRRLVAHAPAPSDATRVTDLRRMIIGASQGGADRILVALDKFGLVERAVQDLEIPVEIVDALPVGAGHDTARAAAALRDHGADVLVVQGGDGTHRQVARGWRDAPVVAIAGGTNNAFAQSIEPTIAGAAAAIAASGIGPIDGFVGYQSLIIDIDVEGVPLDIALVDVAVMRDDPGGNPSVWSLDNVDQVFTSIAEPWSVGLSALAGLVAPTSRTDDRGVLLDLDAHATQRVRAPIAPGHYVDAGLRAVSIVEPTQSVSVRGPALFAVDGERGGSIGSQEWASMTLRRSGLRVIDIRRTFATAVRSGHFYSELAEPS